VIEILAFVHFKAIGPPDNQDILVGNNDYEVVSDYLKELDCLR
jgi:hypothetical protein